MQLNYVLVSDSTSYRALLRLINFTLQKYHDSLSFRGVRADFSRLIKKPKNLSEKNATAIDLFYPMLLFVHRDAGNEKANKRENEIDGATDIVVKKLEGKFFFVKIIPSRITEAWLLAVEYAIRKASGN